MVKKKKNDEDVDEDSLLAKISKKLSASEFFLVKGKAKMEEWEHNDEFKSATDVKTNVYMDLSHIMSVSDERLKGMVKGYSESVFSFANLHQVVEFFRLNGSKHDVITLHFKPECPLLLTNGKVWVALAPRVEIDEDEM